jgi:hypothetical protein
MKWIIGIPVMIATIALLSGLAYLMNTHLEAVVAIFFLFIIIAIVWLLAPIVGEQIIDAFSEWRQK